MARPAKIKAKMKKARTNVRAVHRKPERDRSSALTHPQAERAMSGDIDGLLAIVDDDAAAYKWLSVASDFGHPADAIADRLMSRLSSRQTGSAHFELGIAYLRGTEGVPRDLDRAYAQLQEAALRDYPMSASPELLEAARIGLDGAAFAVFNSVYTEDEEVPSEYDDEDDDGEEDASDD